MSEGPSDPDSGADTEPAAVDDHDLTAEQQFQRVVDELYQLTPAQFTPARDGEVLAAKSAGYSGLAKAIAGLRKPTQAAWLANLLARTAPDDLAALLTLGASLREAEVHLDGEELKRLLADRRAVVSALVRTARKAAYEAGNPVAEGVGWELETTLTLAMAHDEVGSAIASGTLVSIAKRDDANPGDVRLAAVHVDPNSLTTTAKKKAGVRSAGAHPAARADGSPTVQRSQIAELASAGVGESPVPTVAQIDQLAVRRLERASAAEAAAAAALERATRADEQAGARHRSAVSALTEAVRDETVVARRVDGARDEVERLEHRLAIARGDLAEAEQARTLAELAREDADRAASTSAAEVDQAASALAAAQLDAQSATAALAQARAHAQAKA